MTALRLLAWLSLLALLAACDQAEIEASPPAAQVLAPDDLGYFCSMIVADHEGPKAQIILDDGQRPLWFTSARDGLAFMRLPGEPRNVAAIYVTDMGSGAEWAHPEKAGDVWIDARNAWFVIESDKVGGMGAAEAVPFAAADRATAFTEQFGGRVVSYDDLPEGYILSSH